MGDFDGAGKVPGIELWRIEKLKPVKAEFNGKLYGGDSYILLATTKVRNARRNDLYCVSSYVYYVDSNIT